MGNFKKVFNLLSSFEKKHAILLFVMIIVGMFMEMLGLGLIIPLIMVITQENITETYPQFTTLFGMLGSPSQAQLLLIVMIALVAIFTIKNFFLAYLTWKQISFSTGVKMRMSLILFRSYLDQNYSFHLQRNSAELIRNIINETTIFGQMLTLLMYIITESVVLIGISALTIWVEPLGIVVVVALAIAVFLFYYSTRPYITKWGEERQFHEGLRLQHVQQGLGGVKDVIVFGRQADFLNKFRHHNRVTSRASQMNEALKNIPRLFLELLVIASMCLLVGFMVILDRSATEIISTLGIFAAASFRIIPSINRLIGSVQSLRFSLPAINTMGTELEHYEVSAAANNEPPNFVFTEKIRVDDLTFSYSADARPALKNVSFSIRKGDSVGIIGESGSGKSTLVDIILGLFTPDDGRILVDGLNIEGNIRGWQNIIGYVPQVIYLTDDTLKRNIAFGLADGEIDDEAVRNSIDAAQLTEFVESLDDGLETFVGEGGVRLSGGQRQRIGIARALYHNPQILVLDEATSSLDMKTEKNVMESVLKLHGQKTIVIVAHRISTVEKTDMVIRLDKGRIVDSGRPDAVLKSTVHQNEPASTEKSGK